MGYFSEQDILSKEEPATDWAWEQFGMRYDPPIRKQKEQEVQPEPEEPYVVKIMYYCRKCKVDYFHERMSNEYDNPPFETEHWGHGLNIHFID